MLSPLAETPLTTQYQDRLYLDAEWIQNAECGLHQQAGEQTLVAAHPSIFPNFYSYPDTLDRNHLRQIANFVINGSFRFLRMLQCLYLVEGDLLAVAERWYRGRENLPAEYYLEWQFVHDAVRFVETEYAAHDQAGLTVTSRFYRAVADAASALRLPTRGSEGTLSLAPDTYLVTVAGDIIAAIHALSEGRLPHPSILDRTITVVVRHRCGKRVQIDEMPELALLILRHAQENGGVGEVVEELRRRRIRVGGLSPETIAAGSIEHLARQGFLASADNSPVL
jgi:hypothetical protein